MSRTFARAALGVALVLPACTDATQSLAPPVSAVSLNTAEIAPMLAIVQTEWRCAEDMPEGCTDTETWGWIAFSRIVTVNADGSNPMNLTSDDHSGLDERPSWSPDGNQIAFSRKAEIVVVSGAGGVPRQLTTHPAVDGDPAWSPDGARIAFHSYRDGQAQLYVMNAADGSNVRQLTSGVGYSWNPDWSPSGDRIAFTCFDGTNTDICVINADGSNLVRLTSSPGLDMDADWSPGGELAFFTERYGGREIAVMNGDGTGVRRLAANLYGSAPDWSADGSRIAFSGVSQVYVINADGTNPIPIIEGGSPAWRPVNTAFPPPPPPVDTPPVAAFTHQCSGLTCTLDGRSSTDDRGIVLHVWDLGVSPGGSANGAVVTTTYPEGGPRSVTLTVTDAAGQTGSVSRTIDVVAPPDQPPNAKFTVSCAQTKCTFDGRTSTDDRGIVSYTWNLGRPGGTVTGAVVTNDYRHTGSFTVTLTVKDAAGQSSTASQSVTVVR